MSVKRVDASIYRTEYDTYQLRTYSNGKRKVETYKSLSEAQEARDNMPKNDEMRGIQATASGTWQVHIRLTGVPTKSKNFSDLGAAKKHRDNLLLGGLTRPVKQTNPLWSAWK